MVNFTALSGGGLSYYQESEPTGSSEEIWVPNRSYSETQFTRSNVTGLSQKWSNTVPSQDITAVEYDDGVIYASSLDQNIRALDTDGNEIWSYQASQSIIDMDISDRLVFIGCKDGTVEALYHHSGTVKFSDSPTANQVNALAYDDVTDRLWASSGGGDIRIYNMQGTTVSLPVNPSFASNANAMDAYDGLVYGVDTSDNLRAWNSVGTEIVDATETNLRSVSVSEEGLVYSGASSYWFVENQETFTRYDSKNTGATSLDLNLHKGILFAASDDGTLKLFDVPSFGKLAEHSLHNSDVNSVAVNLEDKVVYTGAAGANVYAASIDASDSNTVQKRESEQPRASIDGNWTVGQQ